MMDKQKRRNKSGHATPLKEELVEAQLRLELIIAREKRLRREAEGLRILNASRNSQEMLENLLGVLKKFIPIENGFIIFERKDGDLQTRKLTLAKEHAEAASKTKSDFLANMSHEVRTPMNAIINFSALALEGELPPVERQYIEEAGYSSKGLLGIINEIIDLSKIEAGMLSIESTPFNLGQTVSEVTGLLNIEAKKRAIIHWDKVPPLSFALLLSFRPTG